MSCLVKACVLDLKEIRNGSRFTLKGCLHFPCRCQSALWKPPVATLTEAQILNLLLLTGIVIYLLFSGS